MLPRLAIFGGFDYMVSISMKNWSFDVFCGLCIFAHLRLQTSFLWRWKMAVFCMIYVLRICRFMAKEPPKTFLLQHIFLPFCQIVNTQNPTVQMPDIMYFHKSSKSLAYYTEGNPVANTRRFTNARKNECSSLVKLS